MRTNVLLEEFGVELDLTRDDLGQPDLPGLWERLHRNCRDGVLRCIDPTHPEGAPPWLYLRQNEDGTREARHISGVEHRTAGESNEHKALKERIARAAQSGGFDAEIEQRAANGRRRTDVLVRGDGLLLGCEPQLSPITTQTVRLRTKKAAIDGITSLWMTNSTTSKVIDQAPWARIDRKPWHEYRDDTELPVRGGVRSLQMEQCSRMGTVCPDKKARRPCRGWHGTWTDARQLERFDDLIVRAAARELLPVHVRHSATRSAWFWVPAADLDKIEPTERGDTDLPLGGMIVRADSSPRLREQVCRYGQDSGHRSPPAVGSDRAEPVSVSLTDSAMPLKMAFLDWSGPRHWAAQALPCRLCRRPVNTRDDQARPCHKTCAEEELWRG